MSEQTDSPRTETATRWSGLARPTKRELPSRTKRQLNPHRPKRPRPQPRLTREAVMDPPKRAWIGPVSDKEDTVKNPILAIEEAIFGKKDFGASCWKRSPGEPEPREWPLPEARASGALKGRPLPRQTFKAPRSRRA